MSDKNLLDMALVKLKEYLDADKASLYVRYEKGQAVEVSISYPQNSLIGGSLIAAKEEGEEFSQDVDEFTKEILEKNDRSE